ncbi:MAG: hypothetical protein FJ279_36785, partial [Planctomycetes bacterium]|nr:hypothetical protein [Planctomycetota bacterium]
MDPRPIQAFRELTQCYGFTWDPALRALAEATFDAFSDSDTELLLTKMQYGSSTYKTSTDVRGLIEGWQLFGLPKYGETARRVSRFWWNDCLGTMPVTYNNPWGVAGAFLYEQTRDPAIPSALDFGLRRMATYEGGVGASYIAAFFEGAPYAMSVVARHGEDSLAPWVAYRDYGFPTSVVVFKGLEDALDLAVQTPGSESRRRVVHTPLKPEITLQVAGGWPAGMADWTGGDLHTIVQRSNGAASVRVPKDAPAGAYEIVPAEHGAHFVLAGKPTPMVLHAPKYWMLPDISPAARIYFSLPPVAADAQIFFEGKARLFDPEGQPFADPAGVNGWVNLPGDRPGLWRFEPIENRLVRGRNFPPFFAFGRPAFHFEPPMEWEKEPPARGAVQAVAQDSLFTDGAVAGKGNQALYLAGKKTLTFPAGAPHGAGDGGLFVPHREATIEFFFKPSWSTFDLGPGDVSRSLVQIMTDQRSHWSLVYRLDPKGVNINLSPQEPSHSLFGSMYLNDASRSWLRVWRTETLFERDEWAHIAWVWGMEDKAGPHKERLRL